MTINDIIKNYNARTGKLPNIEYIASQSGKNLKEIDIVLKDMKDRGELIKYNNKWYLKKDKFKPGKEKQKTNVQADNAIRYIMLLIGCVAVCVSIYYSSVFLSAFMPDFLACALGFVMVIYGSGGIEIGVIASRKKHYILSVSLSFTAIIVIFFSMISTVLVQYKIVDNITYEVTEFESTNLKYKLQSVRNDIERTQKLLSDFTTLEDREAGGGAYYYSTKSDLEMYKTQEQEILSELSSNTEQLIKDVTPQDRIYKWVQNLLHIDASVVQFIISVFPAVFIDLISPLCFAVFLFFRKEN